MKDNLFDENGLMVIKEGVVEGTFCVEGMEVAKISDDYIGENNALAFGKIVFEGYSYVLKPLTKDEYKKVLNTYNDLMALFI